MAIGRASETERQNLVAKTEPPKLSRYDIGGATNC